MCIKCLEAARKWFPDVKDSEVGTLLMGATAYPFGGPEIVEQQLAEHVANGCTTLAMACARCDEEINQCPQS